jgi:hypothetical protein
MDQVLGVSAKGGEMSLQGPRLACVFVQQQDQLRVRGRPGNVLGGEEFETVSEQRYQNNTRLHPAHSRCNCVHLALGQALRRARRHWHLGERWGWEGG